jgi:hypothetical protein
MLTLQKIKSDKNVNKKLYQSKQKPLSGRMVQADTDTFRQFEAGT